jgi:hypothetical protein
MKGIHCACKAGSAKTWSCAGRRAGRTGRLSVGVGGDAVTWVPVAVVEEKARALGRAHQGR